MKQAKALKLVFVGVMAVLVAAPVLAAPATHGVADVVLGATQAEWVPTQEYAGFELTVSGPGGVSRQHFAAGENPIFDLASLSGEVDGLYNWELTATPVVDHAFIAASRVGTTRADGKRVRPKNLPPRDSLIESGYFRVVNGSIFQPSDVTEQHVEAQASAGGAKFVNAAQLFTQDVEIQGSLCVGFDCVNGESFGADTLRLKENNLRIHFNDTSNSASFPSNDWRLVANDSTNGGRNIFYLEDSDTGRQVVSVEAGAPSNSLYVASSGNIGVGTSTPGSLEIYVKDGDTPTLRLDQDSSSGFTAQTWDIAGNETNFFVRDVTNGSKLPFKIRPGADDDRLVMEADDGITMINKKVNVTSTGEVGIGTQTPGYNLTVEGADASVQDLFSIEATNATAQTVRLRIANAAEQWYNGVTYLGNLTFNANSNAGTEAFITPTGDMTIMGTLTTGGTACGSGCDRVFSPDYKVESIQEHAAEMWRNSYLPAVGPTAPNKPFNLTEKTGGMLNELEKAHIYIEQLSNRLDQKESELTEVKKELTDLQQAVQALSAKQ